MTDMPMRKAQLGRLLATCQRQADGEHVDRLIEAGLHAYSRTRQYRIYLPADYDPAVTLPLLVVLHGCQQSHLDIQQVSAFDAIADRERCIVVYPYVTSYIDLRTRNCWAWWKPAHRVRGQGEVADIWRIVEAVRQDYGIDPDRIHITGLSSGAAMAVACAVAYSDCIASVASVAGVAYGESLSAANDVARAYKPASRLATLLREGLRSATPPGLLVIQSMQDRVIAPEAADGLIESWRLVAGLTEPTVTLSGRQRGARWRYQAYQDGPTVPLASLRVEGPAHGWMGGHQGPFSTPDAPAISELIWSHCRSHRRLTPADEAARTATALRLAS